MTLSELDLKLKYRSDNDQLYSDFYFPCLSESNYYDRAAGYFSSSSLKMLAQGLEIFLFKGGKIRIIANPFLSTEDIIAIEKGHKAKIEVIESALIREIEVSNKTLQDDTLNVMAWLIYTGQLEMKFAFTNQNSIYHEKFGIFTDEAGNSIAFSGSANETYGGLVANFEKIDVYSTEADLPRIKGAINDFDMLWNNETKGLTVIDIPDLLKEKILENKKEYPVTNKIKESIEPREYQSKAIQALLENNWHGILEMATGTGKTITSLFASRKYKEINGEMFLVIYAPFTHLVLQWEKECRRFGFENITLCYDSKTKWYDKLENTIRDYNIGLEVFHVVITTYKTASSNEFNYLMKKIANHAVLIADECHYIGSKAFKNIDFNNFNAKIGLSATPDRWWDEAGTSFLKNIFDKVVYEYSLVEAIDAGKLTQYEYFPHVTELTESEQVAYKKLTLQIIKMLNNDSGESDEYLEQLYRKRANILAKAYNKIPFLISLLKEEKETIKHTLVYCAGKQVNELTKVISELGIKVHKFDSTVSNKERKQVLNAFEKGEIEVLVAIKCLDEGVDVPSTKKAYFLASTSNPREFVQRRGRILRTSKNKVIAEIHDFIVLAKDVEVNDFTMVAKKELPRFAEFSSAAINQSSAKQELYPYLERYNLNYLMDLKPWDVYREMKENSEDGTFE